MSGVWRAYGAQTVSGLSRVQVAVASVLKLLYPTAPQPDKRSNLNERNQAIRERYAAGESLSQLARTFGISFQRVQQIIKHRRK